MAHLVSNPEKRIIGGRVELGDATDIRFTIKVSRVGERLEGVTHPGSFVLGCNMIVPRSVLDELGPFDERFIAGARYRSGEDTDMLYRAHRRGIPVEYVPDMVVHHFHGRKTEQALKQLGQPPAGAQESGQYDDDENPPCDHDRTHLPCRA